VLKADDAKVDQQRNFLCQSRNVRYEMPTLSISVMGKFQADDEGKEHVSRIDSGGRHGKGGVVGCHQAGSCKCSPPTLSGGSGTKLLQCGWRDNDMKKRCHGLRDTCKITPVPFFPSTQHFLASKD